VPGEGPGDNLGFVWNVWWFRSVMGGAQGAFFDCPYLFAPLGTSLVLHTHTALQSLVGATVLANASIVRAHNLTLLAGLAANGIATYALAWQHTRRALPAVLAGVVFAASAYIGIHLLGHFNLVHAWTVPATAATWLAVVSRPTVPRALSAAIAFAATIYSDYYYAIFTVLFAALWLAGSLISVKVRPVSPRSPAVERLILALAVSFGLVAALTLATGGFEWAIAGVHISVHQIRNLITGIWLLAIAAAVLRTSMTVHVRVEMRARVRALALPLGIAIAVVTVGALPLAVGLARMIASGDYVSQRYFWRSAPRGIDLLTTVTGNPVHALYGPAVRALMSRLGVDVIEQTAWLGIVPIGLLAYGFRKRLLSDTLARLWVVVGLVFLVWAAGPFAAIAGIDTGVVLPQMFARFVPLIANARIPGRAFVVVQLAGAVLTALVVSRANVRPRTVALLIAIALLDGAAVPFPTYPVPSAGTIEAFIAAGPPGVVLELPTGLLDGFGETGRFDGRTLIYQTAHGHPLVGGYVSRISPRIRHAYSEGALGRLIALSSNAATRVPDDFRALLESAGVTYLVVNTERIGNFGQAEIEKRGLRFVTADGPRFLYVLER
jgi:hypothetical protein